MRRLLNRIRWRLVRAAMHVHRALPQPIGRCALRFWAWLPAPSGGSSRFDRALTRLGGFMVESTPDAAVSLARRWARHPKRLTPTRRLATALIKAGHSESAVPLLRAATSRHPTSADTHADLATALRRLAAGSTGAERYARTALERRDELLREADLHLAQALHIDPSRASFQLEHAELLFERGKAPQALSLLRALHAAEPSAETSAALGVAYHRSEIADFDAALGAYQQAITLNPHDARTLSRLNSVALRAGSWAGWRALVEKQESTRPHAARDALFRDFEALFRDTATPATSAQLTDALHDLLSQGVEVSPELLHAISARLQAMGEFRLGFDVRHTLAGELARARSNQMPHVAPFRRWAAATACLGHADEVARRFQPYPWERPTPASRVELDAMRTDALFTLGAVQPGPPTRPLPSDQRMAELIGGRRVAIVGPGVASGAYGEEIDAFDVVIRPRYSREFVAANQATSGARTDIAYYSGTDVHALQAEAMPAAEAGDLQLVVARPLSYTALSRLAMDAPWLRFYPRDYSLIMNGALLGITRILHDVLPFAPGEVVLYNVDYYTGARTFATGYRTGRDAHATAGSIVMDVFRAHDLLADFTIHHTLFSRGIIGGAPEVARLAELSPAEYIDALERGSYSSRYEIG